MSDTDMSDVEYLMSFPPEERDRVAIATGLAFIDDPSINSLLGVGVSMYSLRLKAVGIGADDEGRQDV